MCADCGARGPQWASTTQGVFVCIRCAGLHRKLGTHISKVRSVGLDSWNDEQARMVELFGNDKANMVYEAKLDREKPNADTDTPTVEKFIRAKYERKIWVDKELEEKYYGNLDHSSSEESSPATTPTTPSTVRQSQSQQNLQVRSRPSQDNLSNSRSTSSGVNTPKIPTSASTPSLLSFDDNNNGGDDLQQFIIRDNNTTQGNNFNNGNTYNNSKDSVLAMFDPTVQPTRPVQQTPNTPVMMPNGPPPLNNGPPPLNGGLRMPPPINNGPPMGGRGMMYPPMNNGYPPMGRGMPPMNGPPPMNNGFMNGPPPLNNGFMNMPPPLNNGMMSGPPPLNNGFMNGPPQMMGRGYPPQPYNNGMRY